jgi:hypothetical protein
MISRGDVDPEEGRRIYGTQNLGADKAAVPDWPGADDGRG